VRTPAACLPRQAYGVVKSFGNRYLVSTAAALLHRSTRSIRFWRDVSTEASDRPGAREFELSRPRPASSALTAPAQRDGVKLRRKLQESLARRGVKRLQRLANRVARDHAALLHYRLGCAKAALPVLVIDEGQDTGGGSRGLGAPGVAG